MTKKPTPITRVVNPLIIVYEENGRTAFQLHPMPGHEYRHYGMLICDLIRQTAMAFDVPEADVFAWVEKEWRNPTSEHTQWAIKP